MKVSVKPDSWRCYRCGNGGSVVDAAALAWEKTTIDAAKDLAGNIRNMVSRPAPSTTETPDDEERKSALSAVFALLKTAVKGNTDVTAGKNYLVHERKIPEHVVEEALNRGIIGFLPRHRPPLSGS